jgi:hypothetical protein
VNALRRAFAREREAARALGGTRIPRAFGRSAPDLEPIVLPTGDTIICEVKHRKRLPALLRDALAQAARYLPSATPIAIVSERGGVALAVLALADFARLLGVSAPALPRERRRKASPSQMSLEVL